MMYVGMVALYRTAPLAVAAIAGATPTLQQPLDRCYVSADADHRQPVVVRATGFSGGAVVDAKVDGQLVTPNGVQADAAGRVDGEVPAPYRAAGQRRFELELIERGNPANHLSAWSRASALSVTLRPRQAPPSALVRFRGRGFVGPGDVYAHYLRGSHLVRTVRLATPHGACGTFAVRAREIPVPRPASGTWTVVIDQARRSEAVDVPVYVRLTIVVA
jgi:hypothetical protein